MNKCVFLFTFHNMLTSVRIRCIPPQFVHYFTPFVNRTPKPNHFSTHLPQVSPHLYSTHFGYSDGQLCFVFWSIPS